MLEFKVPEIGENIESGTVTNIMVSVGDAVKAGQDLIELETEKASLPVPSSVDGTIKEILVNVNDEVKIGQVIFKIDASGSGSEQAKTKSAAPQSQPAGQPAPQPAQPRSIPSPTSQTHSIQPSAHTSQESITGLSVVVIGGGPGGYAAAFRAADLGQNVTLIDLDTNPGGVCLYRGCIPSKALLHAAKIVSESKDAKEIGISYKEPDIDLDKLRDWKNSVVQKMTGGLGILSKQRKINYIQGRATFLNSNSVEAQKSDGSKITVTYDKAILATGSRPIALPFAPDSKRVLDSTTALEIENIPQSLLLVGGGYIGLELGTVYAELGSQVDVVEMLPQLMTGADRDVANVLEKRLKIIFNTIMTATKVTAMKETSAGIKVSFEDKDGKTSSKEYEKVLVAIGRRPNTENLGLEHTKVTLSDRGFINVNAQLLTADPSIYAIGDITGNPMLAHKASHEGITAAESISGQKVAFEPNCIPAVVFTDPEIAWCGITETEAKAQGITVQVVKFPWGASGRATTLNRNDGMTKFMVEPQTERILGVSIVGPGAGELIAEGVLAIEMGAVVKDLAMSIHPHPTLSETMMETAESFYGHATHIYKPKR